MGVTRHTSNKLFEKCIKCENRDGQNCKLGGKCTYKRKNKKHNCPLNFERKFAIDEIIDIKVNGVKINTEPISSKEFISEEKFPKHISNIKGGFTVENACINLGVLIKDFAECNSIEDTIDFCARFKEPCKIIGIKIPPDYCKNCNNNIRECWRNVIENEWYDM